MDPELIFITKLGYTDPKNPKFELQFDHFLDAIQAVSEAMCVCARAVLLPLQLLRSGAVSARCSPCSCALVLCARGAPLALREGAVAPSRPFDESGQQSRASSVIHPSPPTPNLPLPLPRSSSYPYEAPDMALRLLFEHRLAPLAHRLLGLEQIESAAASDAGGRVGAPRVTALCMTSSGTVPAIHAAQDGSPAVPMLVTTATHVGPVPGTFVPLASPTHSTYRRQPISIRLTGSGAPTPDNGSVLCE